MMKLFTILLIIFNVLTNIGESNAELTSDDLQQQIYILSGVFGGVLLLLLIAIIVLLIAVNKTKKAAGHSNVNRSAAPLKGYDEVSSRYVESQPTMERPQSNIQATTTYGGSPGPVNEPFGFEPPNRYGQVAEAHPPPLRNPQTQKSFGQTNPAFDDGGTRDQRRGLRNFDNYGY